MVEEGDEGGGGGGEVGGKDRARHFQQENGNIADLLYHFIVDIPS